MHGDTQSSALLNHVLSQTKANLEFLVSQNYISNADASGIISKLSAIDTTASASDVLSITDRTRQLNMNSNNERDRASSPPRAVMPTKRPVPPPLAPRVQQAKAIWDYNVGGSVSISFRFFHPMSTQTTLKRNQTIYLSMPAT